MGVHRLKKMHLDKGAASCCQTVWVVLGEGHHNGTEGAEPNRGVFGGGGGDSFLPQLWLILQDLFSILP